jgi:hypothetical protein
MRVHRDSSAVRMTRSARDTGAPIASTRQL